MRVLKFAVVGGEGRGDIRPGEGAARGRAGEKEPQ